MTYQAQATIPYFSGLPEDVVTNVWHFDWLGGSAPTSTNYGNLQNLIAAFYELVFPESGSITMAAWMVPANFRVKIYDLDDTPPRAPVWDGNTPLNVEQAESGTTPTEVSACLSYHGAIVSGTNPARRRGRFYIGGLGATVAAGSPTSFPMLSSGLSDNLMAAAEHVLDSQGVIDWQWVVWSPTNQASIPVVGGWVDNSFDTQRRRGVQATVRYTWPVV